MRPRRTRLGRGIIKNPSFDGFFISWLGSPVAIRQADLAKAGERLIGVRGTAEQNKMIVRF